MYTGKRRMQPNAVSELDLCNYWMCYFVVQDTFWMVERDPAFTG